MDLTNFACRAIKQKENCLGIVSQLAEASATPTPANLARSIGYLATFSLEFSQGWQHRANTWREMPACLGRCRLLCDLYSHSTWYLCSSCVYPCTICNWVLFFNCFLRQKLLFTWQIVEVLTATPTHGRTPTKERRQPATVLVGPPTDGLRHCSPYPLSPLLQYVQFVESFVASKFLLCFAVVFWPSTVEFTKFVTFVIFATSSTRVRIEVVVGVGVRVDGEREGELSWVWLGLFTQLILITFVYMQRFWNRN